ncbi:MAG: AMP-binding protein, partial [Verrucomicrobiae bacterium]|nr:AMP-binding protein [Verrucomicrobiae bacterium]
LQARLRSRLECAPDRRAIAFVDSRGEFEWLTFGDFYQESARAGHALAENGLRAGDACVFVLSSDRACAATVLGSLLIGAVPTLCAPPVVRGLHSNLPEVVRHVGNKTEARLIVLGDESASLAPALTESGFTLAQVGDLVSGGDSGSAPLAEPDSEALVARQLTSGTTGLPKVCVWKQHRVLASLDGMVAAMGLGDDDIFVNWTPLYHDMGLVNNFLLCLAHGIPLGWLQASDFVKRPANWLRAVHDTGATTTWSPNFGFAMTAQRVTDAEMEGVRLDGVRGFWNAAERIHAESIAAFHERFDQFGLRPDAVKTNFGCAENVGGATFSSLTEPPMIERLDRHVLHDEGIAQPLAEGVDGESVLVVSTGAPYPGMTIRIVGENGETLPEGHVGEVALDTPSRMVGYLDEPEETALAIRGEELFTGDVGYLRNNELFWTGRVRERINLNGKKYDPSDFEGVLFEVDGLREGCFAAFGIDDAAIGSQRLVIVTEVRDKTERSHDEILRDIRRKIAGRMNVSVSEILLLPQAAMSKTSSGKRRHRFYRDLHLAGQLEPVASWAE